MSQCRACKAPIWWGVTKDRKPMPIDAEPNPAGNVRKTGNQATSSRGMTGPEVEVLARGGALFEPEGECVEWWMPHHATCPNAGEFRQ